MLKYQEIEHKYLVDAEFDLLAFEATARRLNPEKSSRLKVIDTYYVVEAMPNHVIRHRVDQELQQLTIKSTGSDNECRTEVNLDLSLRTGNQADAVKAFLEPLRVLWSGTIEKNIFVFYFSNCEVVHYSARSIEASGVEKAIHCVEFEAIKKVSREESLATISRFEASFGFQHAERCHHSLFELLFGSQLPDDVRKFMNARR